VKDPAGAELVFGKQGRVKRDLAPIGKSVARFDTEALVLEITVKTFLAHFERNAEAIRQADFNFFGEEMIGRSVPERVAFVDEAGVNCAGWKHVCGDQR
jgi:hypothetical protein